MCWGGRISEKRRGAVVAGDKLEFLSTLGPKLLGDKSVSMIDRTEFLSLKSICTQYVID